MSTSQRHDELVRILVAHIRANGWSNFKADLPETECPTRITWKDMGKGHIPDVSSLKDNALYIFEVEDEVSINLEHTADQFRLFGAYAAQQGAHFIVLVPKIVEPVAAGVLRNVNAKALIWTA